MLFPILLDYDHMARDGGPCPVCRAIAEALRDYQPKVEVTPDHLVKVEIAGVQHVVELSPRMTVWRKLFFRETGDIPATHFDLELPLEASCSTNGKKPN